MWEEIEELRCNETSLRDQLEMSNQSQKQYKETIAGLESRLTQLLAGRSSEVDGVVSQLKQAEQVGHGAVFKNESHEPVGLGDNTRPDQLTALLCYWMGGRQGSMVLSHS